MPIRMLTFLVLATSLLGCATSDNRNIALVRLLDSMEQRLELAEAVALHKWDQRQPVQAPQVKFAHSSTICRTSSSRTWRASIDSTRPCAPSNWSMPWPSARRTDPATSPWSAPPRS